MSVLNLKVSFETFLAYIWINTRGKNSCDMSGISVFKYNCKRLCGQKQAETGSKTRILSESNE